jgi:DNA polymerase-3 subunit beta
MNTITVDTKTFMTELEWCARFIERKTTIPVLSNVLFEKRGDLLHMTATDLELGAITSVEVAGDGPDFELAAPVHLLIKYLKKVDERSVSLLPEITWTPLCEGPHLERCADGCCCNLKPEVTDVTLRLKHGEDGTMNVTGLAASQFPELPSRPLATVQLAGLETAIPRAVLAISNEQSRFTLNGALLIVKGKQARLVATDGHRLSYAHLESYDHGDVKALIPRKALSELLRLGDSAFFCADDNHSFFAVGIRVIVARKLTGNFPDYERVLPTDLAYAVDVSVAPFRKVLDRVALFADERSHAVLVTVNGALGVTAKAYDRGGADGRVPIDCVRRLDGANGYDVLPNGLAYPYGAGFNADYVADFLKAADVPEVRFLFNKCSTAAEWTAPGWRYVLMPMRDLDQSSDPCAVGDFEALQWAKDEAPSPTPVDIPEIAPIRATDAPVEPAACHAPIDINSLKARAIALRREKVSLSLIAKELNAPQSSVWRWTREVAHVAV